MKERTRKWNEKQCPYCISMQTCVEGNYCFATIGKTKQDTFAFSGITTKPCSYYENEATHIVKMKKRAGII